MGSFFSENLLASQEQPRSMEMVSNI